MADAKALLSVFSKNPKYSEICDNTPKNAKSPMVKSIKIISTEIQNEKMQNDATDQLNAAAESFKNGRMQAPGEFFLEETRCEAILFGKEHAKAKKLVFANLLNNERTEKTGQEGFVPNKETWVSHVIVQSTETKGQTTAEGTNMVAANLLSGSFTMGNIDINDPKVRNLMSSLLEDDGKTVIASGLISRIAADSLVLDLQSIAPEGTRVGYIPDHDGDEFSSMVVYDVTKQYTPGMFKVGRGIPRKTNRNPTAQELLEVNLGKYQNQADSQHAVNMVYRVNALSRFNLIRLATPYQEDILPKTGNLKKLGFTKHGISRTEKNLRTLNLALNKSENDRFFDWTTAGKLLEFFIGAQTAMGYDKEVHKSIFVRDSKADKACDKRRGTKILLAKDIADIKKGPALAELYFDIVLNQGKAASIMNILASENRMANFNHQPTGVLSNIGYLLKTSKDANTTDKSSVSALQRIKNTGLFRPFGLENGVIGKSSGTKGEQKFNLAGRTGKNRSQLTLAMVPIGGKTVIGLKAVPLSEGAFKHRTEQTNKRYTKKPANKQKR